MEQKGEMWAREGEELEETCSWSAAPEIQT